MTDFNPQRLIEAIEDAGREWREYSGRGMMGARCVGTTINEVTDLFQLGQELEGFPKPKIDNMGRSFIVYWPRFKIIDDQAEQAAS
jgi:hypothetical protein